MVIAAYPYLLRNSQQETHRNTIGASQQMNGQRKRWCVYYVQHQCIMEYYSAMRESEITSFEGTWMVLEIIIPSEIRFTSQDQILHIYIITKKERDNRKQKKNHKRYRSGERGGKESRRKAGMGIIKVCCVHVKYAKIKSATIFMH